ncbi:hypothetical protein [Dactylosporangium sp. CA-139066]|uniref:hypothetical protein n=1 Tax=Dactylosporangium sp. CA-139066 TaxID=3239930 RepID=UPI003D8AFE0D
MKLRRFCVLGLSVLCGVGMTLGVAGCIKAVSKLTTACGIAIDGSGSSSSTNGFNADQSIEQTVVPFLNKEDCRRVAFAPITDASQGSKCQPPTIDIDPDLGGNVDVRLARGKRRQDVLAAATELLKCIRADKPKGTDVLGGLSLLATRHPEGAGQYKLLVISDFLEEGPNGVLAKKDLHTEADRKKVMDQMGTRIPDLTGADMAVVGFGKLLSADARKYPDFNAFWNELLRNRAHCASVHLFNATATIAPA